MSRTVCSWCKTPLVLKDDVLVCSNTDCPACDEKYLHEELIRTRKELDVAKDAIDVISLKYHKDTPSIFLIKYAQNAKAEITALEQKDVKCQQEQI